jgi:hypothetical protein
LMRRYLLGDLPESVTNDLELQVLHDDEKFEEMWEAENRLVDGYVRGNLPAADKERFERHYQSSPVHRQRVAVARNLVEEADRSRATPIRAREPWFAQKFGFPLLSWQSALAAAALLFAVTSIWLLLDRSRSRQEQQQLRAESQSRQTREEALSQQLATNQAERKRLESENEQLRTARNDNVPPAEQEGNRRPAIYSLLLIPTLVRGGDDAVKATIPPQTDFVRLQMKVDQQSARGFQVNVRNLEGQQVWNQQIKPADNHTRTISVQIPAGKLPLGDYILTLSAVDSTAQTEEINRYFFRVIRK